MVEQWETKRIRYHSELKGGVEELKTLNGFKRNLALWIKNRAGLRVACTAISEKPIPQVYLTMIGKEVFHGCPISIRTGQKTPYERSVNEVLDLCGCINRESVLPPLFPGIKTLMDYGTKRVYIQPALNLPETGILLGRTGDYKDVRFSRADRSRHCYIIGATGTGKSTLLYNMIRQDIENGEGVAVIDPHGDLYQQVLESIPRRRVDDVVLVDPSDFKHSVGINFLEYDATNKPVQMNFITNALLRPIIGQPKSTINFREIIDSGKIFLVNLSKGLLRQSDTQLLGMLIIGKIFTAAMSRVKSRMERRRPMFLYVDEFQNFTTDTVAYLLSEARKFGLYLTLANQNLAQLSATSGRQNILDAVLGNVGTTLIFRLGAVDAAKMDVYTRPELQAQDLQELPDFHAAGRLLVKNSPSRPFVFKTISGLEVRDGIDVNSIVSASRRKYAMPTKQVEEGITARRSMYKYYVETLHQL